MFIPAEYGAENIGEYNMAALGAAVVEPSYVGWWSAALIHCFTTQMPATTFVAALKQVPAREIEGNLVRIIKLSEHKFFGHEIRNIFGRPVPISTPVKTLIDCLDRPDLCGGAIELIRITHRALGKADARESSKLRSL